MTAGGSDSHLILIAGMSSGRKKDGATDMMLEAPNSRVKDKVLKVTVTNNNRATLPPLLTTVCPAFLCILLIVDDASWHGHADPPQTLGGAVGGGVR
jgi:hypothetical protein